MKTCTHCGKRIRSTVLTHENFPGKFFCSPAHVFFHEIAEAIRETANLKPITKGEEYGS
jgi:hypothetical protein